MAAMGKQHRDADGDGGMRGLENRERRRGGFGQSLVEEIKIKGGVGCKGRMTGWGGKRRARGSQGEVG